MRSSKYGLGLAIAAACMAIGAGSASAATLNVVATTGADSGTCGPAIDPCKTIGQAVTNSTDDDTIEVAAGTYTELVNVTKRLTINGAQQGVDARNRAVPGQETVVNGPGGSFNIPGSNVTLDGLTVSGNTGGTLGAGIAMSSAGSNRRLLNTIVEDNTIGLSLNNDDDAATVIRHNEFRDNDNPGAAGGTGIYGDAGINNVVIDENDFSGNPNTAMNLASTGARNKDVEVTDNTFDYTVLLINVDDAEVSGNSFTADDATALLLDGVRDVNVDDNSIAGAGFAGLRVANVAGGSGPSRNVAVTGNTISGNNSTAATNRGGIRVDDDGYAGVLRAQFNRIVGNTVAGVSNASNETRIDAENNWWGCNTGPNMAGCDATVGDDIDSNPWLVLGAKFNPDLIQTGGSSTLKADLSVNSDGEDFAAPPFPNTPVALSATGGTVTNATRTLQDGGATTTYTAGGTQGTFAGTATLDGQAANAPITVKNPTNGATGPQGLPGAAGAQGTSGLTPSSTTVKTKKTVVSSRSLRVSKSRKLKVKVTCPRSNGLCEGTIKIARKGKVIARQAFLVRGGRSGTFTIRMSKSQYKKLKKSQKVSVNLFSRDTTGAAARTAKTVTLKK